MTMTDQFTREGLRRTRGVPQRDANHARAQLDAQDWSARKSVMAIGVWRVYTTAKLAESTAYSNQAKKVIAVNPATWKTISASTKAQAEFLTNMSQGASGIKFLVMDTGFMAEAVRTEARMNDGGTIMAKDLLTQVVEESERLIVQASGLTAASQLQLQVFMSRYGEVQAKLVQAEELLAKARSLVELAGDTIGSIE